jgi:hypothetical protein
MTYFPLAPIQWFRNYLNQIEVRDQKTATIICSLVPPSCPFQRKIQLFGKTLLAIPPLCHINPFYEELMALRFRALNFLSEINI